MDREVWRVWGNLLAYWCKNCRMVQNMLHVKGFDLLFFFLVPPAKQYLEDDMSQKCSFTDVVHERERQGTIEKTRYGSGPPRVATGS